MHLGPHDADADLRAHGQAREVVGALAEAGLPPWARPLDLDDAEVHGRGVHALAARDGVVARGDAGDEAHEDLQCRKRDPRMGHARTHAPSGG